MTGNDFVSAHEIAADAAQQIADEGFKKARFTFYLSVIHRAVEELALDTFYKVVTKDIFNWNECGDMKFEIPANLFNIKEIYLFNSNCGKNEGCDCSVNEDGTKCCWTGYKIVHWKRLFNRFGSTGLKTSKIGAGHYDYVNAIRVIPYCGIVYAGLQDGVLALSDNAKGFANMRIVANGFASSNSELPVIPRMARQAIVDKCKERVLYRLKHKDPTQRQNWIDAFNDLNYGAKTASNPGSWVLVRRRLGALDGWAKAALNEYFAGIDSK